MTSPNREAEALRTEAEAEQKVRTKVRVLLATKREEKTSLVALVAVAKAGPKAEVHIKAKDLLPIKKEEKTSLAAQDAAAKDARKALTRDAQKVEAPIKHALKAEARTKAKDLLLIKKEETVSLVVQDAAAKEGLKALIKDVLKVEAPIKGVQKAKVHSKVKDLLPISPENMWQEVKESFQKTKPALS
jgi:hypothetical protein